MTQSAISSSVLALEEELVILLVDRRDRQQFALNDASLKGHRRRDAPDYGDAVEILDDEVPVFWGCGVTPQWVAQRSGLPLCITHAPGKMFVTDLKG